MYIGKCPHKLEADCLNNGYQDPVQCDRCRCPQGLGGRYCDTVASTTAGNCDFDFDPSMTSLITSLWGNFAMVFKLNQKELLLLLSFSLGL